MSLKLTLILSIGVVAFMIGVHQTIMHGLMPSYWLFMISFACLLLMRYYRKKEQQQNNK